MINIVKIKGLSMSPRLWPGDYLVVIRRPFFRIKVGDLVVVEQDKIGLLVKSVRSIKNNMVFLEGTHDCSVDSRHFGEVHSERVIAKAIYHFKKPRIKSD